MPAGLPPGPALPVAIPEPTVVDVPPAGKLPDGMLPVAAPAPVSVAPAGILPDGLLAEAAGTAGAAAGGGGAGAAVTGAGGGGGGSAHPVAAVAIVSAATARGAAAAAAMVVVFIVFPRLVLCFVVAVEVCATEGRTAWLPTLLTANTAFACGSCMDMILALPLAPLLSG
jgi:hypothetical protein